MGFKTAGFPHYAFNPVGFRQRGSGIPAQDLIFKNLVVQDQYYEDYVGKYQAPENHDYRNAHLTGDGVTAIYFYPGLDGETVWLYNIGTSSWVSQTYNHATGIVLGNGVEILEAYTSLGDVYPFEEVTCATLYNLKGENHGYIDATGATLIAFRVGRNNLPSEWGTAERGKVVHAYGHTTAIATSGALEIYRLTSPAVTSFDINLTYNIITDPIIYDFANTEIDGSGNYYGMRVNSDYTVDFYRKDAGTIVVLDSTVNAYPGSVRVKMDYNEVNDLFQFKVYEFGSPNHSEILNIQNGTYPLPTEAYQHFDFPNGDETFALETNGTEEEIGDFTVISGTGCIFLIPSACTLSDDAIPVITGFVFGDDGNRRDAQGGLLEYVGKIKFNADFVNSNCINFSTTGPTMDFATPLAGGETLEYQGTATLALSTTQITISAIGTVFDMKIYDGETLIHHYAVAEGGEDTLYDLVGGNKITLNSFNLDDWSEQDEYHYNMVNGFDAYENTLGERLFVPIGSTVTQAGYALLDTFVQDGKSLLPCETDISFPQAPALVQADVDNVLFDVSGNPLEIDWKDVINATAEQEVIGIESTVGKDGQAQAVVDGLSVQNEPENNDFSNGQTGWNLFGTTFNNGIVFNASSDSGFFQSNAVDVGNKYFQAIFVEDYVNGTVYPDQQTGLSKTLANGWNGWIINSATDSRFIIDDLASGWPSQFKVTKVSSIKMDGNIESWTEHQMLALVQTMKAGTDLQHLKNPDVISTHSDTIQKSIMSIRGTGGADWIGRSVPAVTDKSYTYFKKNVQNVFNGIFNGTESWISFVSGVGANLDLTRMQIVGYATDNDLDESADGNDGIIGSDSNGNVYTGAVQTSSATGFNIILASGSIYLTIPESELSTIDSAGFIDYLTTALPELNIQLATPIITDAEITVVDENGNPQDYWHLYENGQISGEAEDLLPIVKYRNLQHGTQIFADTSRGSKKQRFVGYSEEQTGYALTQIYRALNK